MSNHNRQKSNKLSSSDGTSQNANLKSPNKSKSIIHYKPSFGVNPITHQCSMHRNKPLSAKETELQQKKKGVIKDGMQHKSL